jgi:hypothetical protein
MHFLIATIETFRQHVALNESTDTDYFKRLQPDLLLAEEDYLRPTIGADFYDEFVAAEGTEPTDDRLRYLLQSALANLTMVGFLDVAQVQISGSGLQIISTEREKTAFQWQVNSLKASFSRKGFNGLEKVLAYLEANPTAFPTWASSETAKRTRGQFLESATSFSDYYNISNARLTFQALASLLRKTETFSLEPRLGTDFYDELKQQLADDALTAENRLLLERYIRPALAHLTMAQAIGELGFGLNGAALELNVYRSDDANSKESDPGLTQLLELKADQAMHDGERFLRRLVAHLNATASETRYPTYFHGDVYAPPVEPNYHTTPVNASIFGGF